MLKKKMQREGLYREMKLSRHFETPSAKRKRKAEENERRRRKVDRKRIQES
jgi:small subunit ribosomal protein S21